MIELNGTFIAQIINFLILVVLLRAFAYKPVVNMLKARQDKIQESLDKADADAAEADKLLAQYKAKLAAATAKAEEIQKNAEKRAAEFREAEEQKVKADIERDRAKAVEKLRTEMVSLSMAAAGKIIAKNMDSAENEALIAEFVDKLDKDKIGDLPC